MGKHADKPESGGLASVSHIIAHCIRKEKGDTFTELTDRLSFMPEVCDLLSLHPDALPDPITSTTHSIGMRCTFSGRCCAFSASLWIVTRENA